MIDQGSKRPHGTAAAFWIVLCGLSALSLSGYGADPAPGAKPSAAKPAPEELKDVVGQEDSDSGDLPNAAPEEVPVDTGIPKLKAKKKEKFQKSRLTKDVSEGRADRRKVILSTGEDKTVDLNFEVEEPANQTVRIGNPSLLGLNFAVVDGKRKQIIFKPLKAGETTVSVRDTEGNIKLIFDVIVTSTNLLRRAAEIRELLKDIEGIDVKVVGPNVVIDGELIVPQDYARMMAVITKKPYSEVVLPLATLSGLAMNALARRIQEDATSFAPNVKTRVVNGMLFLEGTVDSKQQADRAYVLAKLYLPEAKPSNQLAQNDPNAVTFQGRELVHNFIVVNPPPPKKQDKLVRVTIHVVELTKDYARKFGFQWSPLFTSDPQISIGQQANGQVGSTTTSFSATLSSLFPKLTSAQNAGFARVLKQGSVIVKSGQLGKIDDEISVPITLPTANGQSYQAGVNTAGLHVRITPVVLGQGEDVEMKVEMDHSAFIGDSTATASTSKKSISTILYVKNNDSAAIGGAETSNVGTGFNRDPAGSGTSDTGTAPIFNLQRTKAYTKSKGQFVVFITPQVIENASEASEDMKKNFRIKVK